MRDTVTRTLRRRTPTLPQGDDRALLSRRTELVLRELDSLPTLPAVATRLLALGFDEKVEIREIVRLIETDPSLTARLLSLCRRAAMKTRHPITTVELAVVMLGLEAVRSLVLSVEIFEWSGKAPKKKAERSRNGAGSDAEASRFNRVGFWQHSIAVACAAELLARELPDFPHQPEEAFVSGLVHDLGKLALDLVLPKAYGRVIELSEQRQGNIADFERPIVGLDHHEAGLKLAERWGLPPMLQEVIAYHGFDPSQLPAGVSVSKMVGLVRAADSLARRLNLGWSGNHVAPDTEADPIEALGVTSERLATIVPKLYEATSARCRDLGLGEEPSQQLLIESILRANTRLGRLNQELADANQALGEAQQELAETRALARLGEMTAGAAHEMNNPLTVICGRAQTLEARARDDQDRLSARAIVTAGKRLTDLITRLNRIATPPAPRMAPVELGDLMSDVIRLAKLRASVTVGAGGRPVAPGAKTTPVPGVKLMIAEGMDPLLADRELLTEALVEVVVNAIESGPRTPVQVRVDPDPREDRLSIRVIDDGAGMSPHALEHATDPFFSEKAAGRQAGLGLAMAHRLVQLHRGELAIESRPGRGTCVTVWVPGWRTQRDLGVARRAAPAEK